MRVLQFIATLRIQLLLNTRKCFKTIFPFCYCFLRNINTVKNKIAVLGIPL